MIHVINNETKECGEVIYSDKDTLSIRLIKKNRIEYREIKRVECFGDVKCSLLKRIFTRLRAVYEIKSMDGRYV